MKESLEELLKRIQKISGEIDTAKTQMSEALKRIQPQRQEYDKKARDCMSYLKFMHETERNLPKVREILDKDKGKIEEIKRRFVRDLEFVKHF